MTFEALDHSLPNGFHDAILEAIGIDCATRKAELTVSFVTGSPEEPPAFRSARRRARVTLSTIQFFIIDPPDSNFGHDSAGLFIDAGPGEPPNSGVKLPPLAPGNFLFWIFVRDWNAFIRVAAANVESSWLA